MTPEDEENRDEKGPTAVKTQMRGRCVRKGAGPVESGNAVRMRRAWPMRDGQAGSHCEEGGSH